MKRSAGVLGSSPPRAPLGVSGPTRHPRELASQLRDSFLLGYAQALEAPKDCVLGLDVEPSEAVPARLPGDLAGSRVSSDDRPPSRVEPASRWPGQDISEVRGTPLRDLSVNRCADVGTVGHIMAFGRCLE